MKIKKHFNYSSNYKQTMKNIDYYYNRPDVFNHVARLTNSKEYGYMAHISFSWRSFMIVTTLSKAENVLNMRLFTSIHCDEDKKEKLNQYIDKTNANSNAYSISLQNGEIVLETRTFFYDTPVSSNCIGQLETNLIFNSTMFLSDYLEFAVSDRAPKNNPEFSLLDLLLSLQNSRIEDEDDDDEGINYVPKKRENTDIDVDSIFEEILKNNPDFDFNEDEES